MHVRFIKHAEEKENASVFKKNKKYTSMSPPVLLSIHFFYW